VYQAISELSNKYTVELLCEVGKVSRSGYYKWLKRVPNEKYIDIIEIIKHEQKAHRSIYGYRRMQKILKNKYEKTINSKALRRLMKEYYLQSVVRRKKPKLFSDTAKLVKPNVLDRDFKALNPNEKYVTDITYLLTVNRTYYLSVIMDLFDRRIVSYKVGKQPDASLSVDVVNELSGKVKLENALIHSDQGIHYTCSKYTSLLTENKVIQSMSRKGNCWDNAIIENFFGHFKCECFKLQKISMKTFEDTEKIVSEYIEFYNNERPNSTLGYVAPAKYLQIQTA